MNTRYIEGWNAAMEAVAKEYDDLARVWGGAARERDHDDPLKAAELTQSAWFRNTSFHVRGMKLRAGKI